MRNFHLSTAPQKNHTFLSYTVNHSQTNHVHASFYTDDQNCLAVKASATCPPQQVSASIQSCPITPDGLFTPAALSHLRTWSHTVA